MAGLGTVDPGDARKLIPSAQDAIRRKAVKAVVGGGMSQTMAVTFFGTLRTSVCLRVKTYRFDGEAGLANKPKGRPKDGKLTQKTDVIHQEVRPAQES